MADNNNEHSNTDSSYYNEVMCSMTTEFTDVKTFDNYFGAEQAIQSLKEYIVFPLRFPQLFNRFRLSNLLLCGPPGCGKSHLLFAVAKAAEVKLFVFHAWNLQNRYIGGEEKAEKLIEAVFDVIQKNSPCILCLEDLEVFSKDESHFKKGKMALLTQLLEKLPKLKDRNFVVVGTTMSPWMVDADLRRLFEKRICVYLPDQIERKQFFKALLKASSHDLKEEHFEDLAIRTQGFSGSDIHCLVRSATMSVIRELMKATHFKKVDITINEASHGSPEATKNLDTNFVTADQRKGQRLPDVLHAEEKESVDMGFKEKLTPCKPDDKGAISMSVLDIPENQLFMEHDITMSAIMLELQSTRPTINDEEIAKLQRFEEDFC